MSNCINDINDHRKKKFVCVLQSEHKLEKFTCFLFDSINGYTDTLAMQVFNVSVVFERPRLIDI